MANQKQVVASYTPSPRALQDALTRYLKGFTHVRWDDSPERTSERVVAAMTEFLVDKAMPQLTTFESIASGPPMVVIKDIEFVSCCAHHLYPYYGVAHFGYLPGDRMVGLSKIPRVIRTMANSPTTQETLTDQIGHYLDRNLQPLGLGLIMVGTHTCCTCRGVRASGTIMKTSVMHGLFREKARVRNEFLEMIR